MHLRVTPRPAKPAAKPAGHGSPPSSATLTVLLDPIITMDEAGLIRSASDSVTRVFGWTPDELFGKNVKVLIPEPRRSALDRYLDRYRHPDRGKALTRARRFDAIRKDGSALQIELSMSRAELPHSAAPFFIGIVRDVSHRIDITADHASERSRLHDLITEQTRALATAHLRLELADRMAALGTLAAGLGHDLGNVLLPVRARLDALDHSATLASTRPHLKAVRGLVAYLQSLSDGLHALALDPEAQPIAAEGDGSTHLNVWWKQVGPLLRKAVPKHVVVSAFLPATLPPVAIAPHWLTQALLNLIVNAGEAIPATKRNGRIRLTAHASHDRRTINLAISDNGSGMSREVQRRALDLFFTTKSRSMGTGLGLPLARKVALRAGGDLFFTSTHRSGTVVTLSLPAAAGAPKPRRSSALPTQRRVAAFSDVDQRSLPLLGQALVTAGFDIAPAPAFTPGDATIWVTCPSSKCLAAARRWRSKHPGGTIILVAPPAKLAQHHWDRLGAVLVKPKDNLAAIRLTLAHALASK